ADVARGAGRLKKERPPRKLGPGRTEKTEIERLRETHTHRAGQAEMAGVRDIFDKNRETVDEERLRYAVHHGAEHRLEPHFVGERATKFDQGAAIVQAVAIKEAIEAGLNPFAEGLEEKRGDHDGDDAADGAVRLSMKDLGDESHEEEVNRGDGGCCRSIGETALEDDVHIHQAITNDGVGEAQRNENQADCRELHPRLGSRVEGIRHDVKDDKRKTADESPGGEPFQLLPQDAGGRSAIIAIEHFSGSQKAGTEIAVGDFIEKDARAEPRNKTKRPQSRADMDEKNRQRGKINNTELRKRPAGSFGAFREDQSEMQQQCRHHHLRQDFDPIDFVIEGVQLSAVVEREENERDEAENIKVHGARRVPAARKNEKADEEIDQANNAGVILDGGWFFGRSSYERSLKLLAVPGQSVAHLRPQPRAPQPLGHLHLPRDGD